ACVIERMSPRSLLAIPRPAASSAARLIRKPEERREMDWLTAALVAPSCRCALSALTLVLMRIVTAPCDVVGELPCSRDGTASCDRRQGYSIVSLAEDFSAGSRPSPGSLRSPPSPAVRERGRGRRVVR